MIPRLKKHQKGIWFGRSKCPGCQHTLFSRDLIPFFSFLINKARCRFCRKPISYFYPIIELTTAFSFILVANKFLGLAFFYPAIFILIFIYTLVLLVIFFYDYLYLEIPDQVLLPAIILALIASFFPNQYIPDLKTALLGAAIPVSFFLAQILISKGRWLGGGDLRIGAFMGLILGWKLVIVALLLSYLIGSIISLSLVASRKLTLKTQVPFGPFLSVGTFITMLWGNEIIEWYFKNMIGF